MMRFDECWKEASQDYLEWFLRFFYPVVAADIDWTVDYETLNAELEKILPESLAGRRYADKLFRVTLRGNARDTRLLHVEIQCQGDPDFPHRMHVYNYRCEDVYHHPVVSLAFLGDDDPRFRPTCYEFVQWRFRRTLEFEMVKLLDYQGQEEQLLTAPNPFAALVVAHLQARATVDDPDARARWKVRLLLRLQTLLQDDVDFRNWMSYVDYLMPLPTPLARQVWQQVLGTKEDQRMPRMSQIEQFLREDAQKDALLDSINILLEVKFGAADEAFLDDLRARQDLDLLRRIQYAIKTATSLDDLRRLLPATPSGGAAGATA